MSKKNTSVLRTFTDEPKKHSCYPILATHLAAKDDSRGGLGASFATSAERLLSEQSVLLLGEANSQTRKEYIMKTDELIKAVIMWGHEHGISNPVMQALKVNEEVGEIATEITHNRLHGPDMIDAIGDSLVTIIILADVLGYNPIDCLQEAYDVISKRKGKTVDGCFVKEV